MLHRILVCLLLSGLAQLKGSAIAEWNGAVLAAIRPQTPPPLLLVRNLAIIHRSAFDAATLCSADSPYSAFIQLPPGEKLNCNAPPALAAAYAAHAAAVTLFPSSRPLFDRLLEDQTQAQDLHAKAVALAVGQRCAEFHLEARKADRLSASMTYIPREEPGQWRRTPPDYRPPEFPHGRHVRPYVLADIEPFLPPGPPDMHSSEWASALEQVREIGAMASSTRTDDQAIIARFWSDFSYTITPPGHWNQIALAIAAERQFTLLQEAHLMAWLNTTMLDAGIVCWEAKYRFNFWRPITAIYRADEDGNDATRPDTSWNSFLESPPHPEYPSGHSSFTGAAARFLQLYFDADKITFDVASDSIPGHVRRYTSLWECAEEISWSRIYGGIHYQFSGDDGLASGKKVAETVFEASSQ